MKLCQKKIFDKWISEETEGPDLPTLEQANKMNDMRTKNIDQSRSASPFSIPVSDIAVENVDPGEKKKPSGKDALTKLREIAYAVVTFSCCAAPRNNTPKRQNPESSNKPIATFPVFSLSDSPDLARLIKQKPRSAGKPNDEEQKSNDSSSMRPHPAGTRRTPSSGNGRTDVHPNSNGHHSNASSDGGGSAFFVIETSGVRRALQVEEYVQLLDEIKREEAPVLGLSGTPERHILSSDALADPASPDQTI